MATEKGIVTRIETDPPVLDTDNAIQRIVWVKTTRTSSCESCASKQFCETREKADEMEVQVIDPLGTNINDRVVVGIPSSSLLKASFLMYVFPIVVMILGAVIGEKHADYFALDPTLASIGLSLLFFFLAIGLVRFHTNKQARKQVYRPTIIRILS